MNYVYVLTLEINQYDQDGEYFVAVFKEKPTEESLVLCGVPVRQTRYVLSGGGRVGVEDEWFHLRKVVFDK